jgi:hypothetical protein
LISPLSQFFSVFLFDFSGIIGCPGQKGGERPSEIIVDGKSRKQSKVVWCCQ